VPFDHPNIALRVFRSVVWSAGATSTGGYDAGQTNRSTSDNIPP